MRHDHGQPEVRVLAGAAAATDVLLGELRGALASGGRPLVSFATGNTFTAWFARLAAEFASGRLSPHDFVGTHLDEYLGHAPTQRGGMVHELTERCAGFGAMLARGTFLPVPGDGAAMSLAAHEARLSRAGGVQLQFLGIGRNGHLAFNEPGTPFEIGFHVTELAATTREDARARFAPDEPPTHAVTAGLASILAARRVVLCAFGAGKAAAVRAMLQGPVDPSCPASVLRRHDNVLVLLDAAAAAGVGDQHLAGGG